MIRVGDIDIDVADRDQILKYIDHVPASRVQDNQVLKHNTGIYVTGIPVDPVSGLASIDYQSAETRGYTKIDVLNNSVYRLVRDRQHLQELLEKQPPWHRLRRQEYFSQIVHIGNHYNLYLQLSEPISSLDQMAQFLALIRPAKRYLVGRSWEEMAREIWLPNADGQYQFKMSHSYSYAHLVVVHMNLLD